MMVQVDSELRVDSPSVENLVRVTWSPLAAMDRRELIEDSLVTRNQVEDRIFVWNFASPKKRDEFQSLERKSVDYP